jgi:phosphatidylethanolamine/phosphatidyl-N-methylethanolamine N-methyltransferase
LKVDVEKVYDRYSGFYDFVFNKLFEKGRRLAPSMLKLFPRAKLLEVGVGTGLSLPFLPKDIEVTGIDISSRMLKQAVRRRRELKLKNVHLLKMDATQTTFPDNHFDRVLAAYFISTVPDPERALAEMKRVCKPGGYIVFLNHFLHQEPLVGFMERAISPLCSKIGFRTDLDLFELMDRANLQVEKVRSIDSKGNWKAVRCVNTKSDDDGTAYSYSSANG